MAVLELMLLTIQSMKYYRAIESLGRAVTGTRASCRSRVRYLGVRRLVRLLPIIRVLLWRTRCLPQDLIVALNAAVEWKIPLGCLSGVNL